MALSEATAHQAKTTGKPYYLSDFDGLALRVSPAGAKAWLLRYYWAGKQKIISPAASDADLKNNSGVTYSWQLLHQNFPAWVGAALGGRRFH